MSPNTRLGLWFAILSTVEDCADDLGSADIGEEYLKLRLSALGFTDGAGLIIQMIAGQVLVTTTRAGFVKIKPNRERPAMDESSKEMFEEFWSLYPRKEAKLRCMRAWDRLPVAEKQLAVEGVKLLALVWSGRPPTETNRYCAMPLTWLNERRYLDNIAKKDASDPSIKAGEKWLEKQV